ncbi:hypothetical protein [Nannocystis pusilla]|uniref:hypothetical protein n=1 Tax=Nannocystis pusilla TaxID=889268 RepID=UPI003B7D7815
MEHPDVIGVYKALPSDRINPHEIISAEIKIDPQASVVAFGQAVAYRLFSTKSYIVMPDTISKEDQGRLEALCMLFGVGLVLFSLNPEQPDFKIRMRAQRSRRTCTSSTNSPTACIASTKICSTGCFSNAPR